MKKKIFCLIACTLSAWMVFAQGVEEVSLVVSGEGATKEEATTVALRSAIEQAFGCFVSANTMILNDELVKDEIVTVASGNIKSYEELNVMPVDSDKVSVSLRAVVAVGKLISYAQSKGSSCELAGAVLSQERRLLQLNITNTKLALQHLLIMINEYVYHNTLGDYKLSIEKTLLSGYVSGWIDVVKNENGKALEQMISNYIAALSIDEETVSHLKEIGFKPEYVEGHYVYAGLSSTEEIKSLRNSIEYQIQKHTLALIVDNTGYVYPYRNDLYYSNSGSNPEHIVKFKLSLEKNNGNESRQFIEFYIPDYHIDKVTNINVFPYKEDVQFYQTVLHLLEQAAAYKEARGGKIDFSRPEDVYLYADMMGTFLYAYRTYWASQWRPPFNDVQQKMVNAICYFEKVFIQNYEECSMRNNVNEVGKYCWGDLLLECFYYEYYWMEDEERFEKLRSRLHMYDSRIHYFNSNDKDAIYYNRRGNYDIYNYRRWHCNYSDKFLKKISGN